jgi:parallel beta-helix repeat protein
MLTLTRREFCVYSNESQGVIVVELTNDSDSFSIQKAINKAEEGSIVYVSSGVYPERIIINKTIRLIGEDPTTTIIDGDNRGTVVVITADNVTISGFTIRNSGWGWFKNGIYVNFADNCEIRNNFLIKNCHNIRLNNSKNSRVIKNVVRGDGYGIRFVNTFNCTAAYNNVSDCIAGVHLENATNCTVQRNRFSENDQGIRLYSPCVNNLIIENTVFNNTYNGMIELMPKNTTLYKNIFFHNNFVNNKSPFIYKAAGCIWDNGYEGNYWTAYKGEDFDRDGIGDTPHFVGKDQDNYPLMGLFNSFETSVGPVIEIISNSTVGNLRYFSENTTIKIQISNSSANQIFGFCRIRIPHLLVSGPYEVIIGDKMPIYYNYTLFSDENYTWIYFSYRQRICEVIIVPEFSFTALLLMITGLTILCLKRSFKNLAK